MKRIEIVSSSQSIKRFQTLLRSEWTEATAQRALKLVRGVLKESGCEVSFPWEEKRDRVIGRHRRHVRHGHSTRNDVTPANRPCTPLASLAQFPSSYIVHIYSLKSRKICPGPPFF